MQEVKDQSGKANVNRGPHRQEELHPGRIDHKEREQRAEAKDSQHEHEEAQASESLHQREKPQVYEVKCQQWQSNSSKGPQGRDAPHTGKVHDEQGGVWMRKAPEEKHETGVGAFSHQKSETATQATQSHQK